MVTCSFSNVIIVGDGKTETLGLQAQKFILGTEMSTTDAEKLLLAALSWRHASDLHLPELRCKKTQIVSAGAGRLSSVKNRGPHTSHKFKQGCGFLDGLDTEGKPAVNIGPSPGR